MSPRLGWSQTLLIHSPRPLAARSTAVGEVFWNNTIPLQHTEEWLLPPRRGLHHSPPHSPDPTPHTAVGQTDIRPTLGKRWTVFVPTIARLFMLDFFFWWGRGGFSIVINCSFYCSDASQSSVVLCRIDTKVSCVPFHSILVSFYKGAHSNLKIFSLIKRKIWLSTTDWVLKFGETVGKSISFKLMKLGDEFFSTLLTRQFIACSVISLYLATDIKFSGT